MKLKFRVSTVPEILRNIKVVKVDIYDLFG